MECMEVSHIPQSRHGIIETGNPVLEYWQLMTEALAKMSVDLNVAPHLANMMKKAGFVNVVEEILFIPIGPWPKDEFLKTTGLFWKSLLLDGLQALALGPFTRALGWSAEKVESWLVEVKKAYDDNKTHMIMPLHVISGQRSPC
jgi:hypothetical protein